MSEPVLLDRVGPVATLTLNRPDVLNTLDFAMVEALVARTAEVADDDTLRVVILRGAGKHFMAGGDIRTFAGELRHPPAERQERFQRMVERYLEYRESGWKPYTPIDLVAVNLYPFEETAARSGTKLDEIIEQIDIGGPSLLRSAAKNFASVTVVVDPSDYSRVLAALEAKDDDLDRRSARRIDDSQIDHHFAPFDAHCWWRSA